MRVMKRILQVSSSVKGSASKSTALSNELVERLLAQHDGAHLTRRDLVAQPVPFLDTAALAALSTPAAARTAEHHAMVEQRDSLIAEIQAADAIVLGVPMYNFAVPIQLKAYFDAIARAGVTFRYTATGPEGLLTGKKVYVVFARGGVHRDTPRDSQAPYVRTVLGFLGMTDVEFVYAEGLDMGADAQAAGLAAARQAIAAIGDDQVVLRAA